MDAQSNQEYCNMQDCMYLTLSKRHGLTNLSFFCPKPLSHPVLHAQEQQLFPALASHNTHTILGVDTAPFLCEGVGKRWGSFLEAEWH